MKTIKFLTMFLAATTFVSFAATVSADASTKRAASAKSAKKVDAPNDEFRADLEKIFVQMTESSIDAMKRAERNNKNKSKNKKPAVKFSIDEPSVPVQDEDENKDAEAIQAQVGVKVWFSLADGTFVNPTRRPWRPNEKFYVHVQAAVPMYVALFQNYPNGEPASRKVYPDARFKDSFNVLEPGRSTRLPVGFKMDDDAEDEIMALVFIRADWEGIQNGLTEEAIESVRSEKGKPRVAAALGPIAVGALQCLNNALATKKRLKGGDVQDAIDDPNLDDQEAEEIAEKINKGAKDVVLETYPADAETSTQSNEVCFYMFGNQSVGQWEMTLDKVENETTPEEEKEGETVDEEKE